MNKEMIETKNNEVALFEDWDLSGDISTGDLVIPHILLQQALSNFVDEGIAQPGQFVDSVDGTRLDVEGKLEIVVFDFFKTWVILERVGNSKEFKAIEPITPENCNLPYQEGDIERVKTFNFYVILAGADVATSTPYVLCLSRTQLKAGKNILTNIQRLKRQGKPAAGNVFVLSTHKEKNDKGSWFVIDAAMGRETTNEEKQAAYSWYKSIKSGEVKVIVDDAGQPEMPTQEKPVVKAEQSVFLDGPF